MDHIVRIGANRDAFNNNQFCRVLGSRDCPRPPGNQVELMHFVMQFLKWRYVFVQSHDGHWATKVGGRWLGFMPELVNGTTDLTVPVMMPLQDRIEATNYLKAIISYSHAGIAINRKSVKKATEFAWWKTFGLYTWFALFLIWILRFVLIPDRYWFKIWFVPIAIEAVLKLMGCVLENFILQRLFSKTQLPFRSLLQAVPKIAAGEFTWVTTGFFGRYLNIAAGQFLYNGMQEALALNPAKIIPNFQADIATVASDASYFAADDGIGYYKLMAEQYPQLLVLEDEDALPIPVISLASKKLSKKILWELDRAFIALNDVGLFSSIDSRYKDVSRAGSFTPAIQKEVQFSLNHLKELFTVWLTGAIAAATLVVGEVFGRFIIPHIFDRFFRHMRFE